MPKTIMALKDADCRFILDEKRGDKPLYCADPVIPGESFCPHHQRICYGAALPRKRNSVSQVGFDFVDATPEREEKPETPDLIEVLAA